MAKTARAVPAAWNSIRVACIGNRNPSTWAITHDFPNILSGRWIGNRGGTQFQVYDMGHRPSKEQLISLNHNACP